jgi:hypothetical protein
LTEEE